MIDIILSARCVWKLKKELRYAGRNEIGGVIAAEQLSDGRFLVRDLSVQRDGTPTSFNRDPGPHRKFMRHFNLRMGNNPERFNYLGEWHSHPGFLSLPSEPDLRQMQAEIYEPSQTSSFLVLLIVKLDNHDSLVGSTHAFRRGCAPVRVNLLAEPGTVIREETACSAFGCLRTLHRFIG